VIPPDTKLSPIEEGTDEKRDYRRRGRGDRNLRTGRPNSFYAIHVDRDTRRAVGVGPPLERDQPYETGLTENGMLRIYPLGRDGLERVWRNSRESLERRLQAGTITLEVTVNDTIVQVISRDKKSVPIKSIWTGARYNAGEQGTNLVKELTGVEFDYPKSLYSVFDCIRSVVGKRPKALVLDYFGGSGTTTHAVMLLNRLDGGMRQSVLVTNNEIGEPQERAFREAGIRPADPQWAEAGICRSVTFPRCKNAILGKSSSGSAIDWEYNTGMTIDKEVAPNIQTLPFLDPISLRDAQFRASLAPWIHITRKALSEANGYYIATAEGCRDGIKGQAILFDPDRLSDFVGELSDADHIDHIWLATAGNTRRDKQIRDEIMAEVGTRIRQAPLMRPAAEGFPENLVHLRLEYLDPNSVEIGRHLDDLLPTLWLMAGALGEVPVCATGAPYVVPADGSFALLVETSAVAAYLKAVDRHGAVRWAFIVTDSNEAFQEIVALLPASIPPTQRVQLYRNYLGNFSINMVEA
jgi:adenine-specific DNA-methyltransferase